MSEMVEVVIESLRVSLTNQQRIVVLRELHVDRYLPIWIGPFEAESITIALQEIEIARPQTHDLVKNLFGALGARLLRVEISALRDDVFYGNLVLDANGETIKVDSRPSDALALAVRAHVPILVAKEVLDKAGIVPQETIETPSSEADSTENGEQTEIKAERLSIFEDFLENLSMNDEENNQAENTDTDDSPEEK
ncbi:MAG: bifunctional nuclease family protein [Anaerolineaceae bacterium]|nr:bifunctional nuclease family protein [Anaerolineaceae bacterium]